MIFFSGMLTILFVILKFFCFIDWPWVLVVSPLWGHLFLFIILTVALAAIDIKYWSRK